MADKFANAFDDIPATAAQDFSGAFGDITEVPKQDFSTVFNDIPEIKKVSLQERIKSEAIRRRDEAIKRLPPNSNIKIPPLEIYEKDVENSKIAADVVQRPLEFVSSPLSAITEFFASGMQPGAVVPPLRDWARPLLSERENVPTLSKAAGIENPFAALAFNVLADPGNLVFSTTLLKAVKGLSSAQKIAEGMKTAKATKGFEIGERFITPTLTKEGKPSTIGRVIESAELGGTKKNLPALIMEEPKPRNIFQFDVNIERKQPFKTEQLVAKDTIQKKVGKELDVEISAGMEEGEKLFRLRDKTGKTYVEVGLKPNMESQNLMLNWLNIDEGGIDIAKPRFERGGKPVQHIHGAYEEIHGALETFAKNNGYKTIGLSEFAGGTGRLKKIGFAEVPLDDIGKVPYTMVKRVGQNVPFEAPDFLNKYRKLIPQQKLGFETAKESLEIYDYASRRSMWFDITKDNKFVFFDKTGNELARFNNIGDAKQYISSIPIMKSNYWAIQQGKFKSAEDLYDLSTGFYNSKAIQEARKGFPYAVGVGRREAIRPELQISTKPHEPDILSKLKTGIKQIDDVITTSVETNDLFDIGTGDIVTVAKGRIPIRESFIEPLNAIRDQPKDFFYKATARGKIMPSVHFIGRHGEAATEMFYRRIKVGELRETLEKNNLRSFGLNQFGLSRQERKALGNYAIALDENGANTLKKMGEVAPAWEQLNGKQQAAFEFGSGKFDEYFGRMNEARKLAGKEPLTYRGNYITFFRDYDELQKLGYHLDDKKDVLDHVMEYIHKNSPTFTSEIERKGGVIALENDYVDIFNKYANNAIHYIHTTPAVAIDRALLSELKVGEKIISLKDSAPRFYSWMQRYLDDVAGKQVGGTLGWFDRQAKELNKNIVTSLLTFNMKTGITQLASLAQSFTELGPKYFVNGLNDWLTSHASIMQKSNLITRQPEQGIGEIYKMFRKPGLVTRALEEVVGVSPNLRKVSRAYQGTTGVINKIGMTPLTFLDGQVAQVTWAGAYKKGKNYLHLGEEAAVNYANDIVVRTQGSGRISDLSEAQRTPIVKSFFTLQTFVNNNWSWLMGDVFGFGNPHMKTPDRMYKAFKLILGVTIMNYAFEDLLGTYSPFPTPIKAYMEEMDNSGIPTKALFKAGSELGQVVPGPGGALRYGSHPLGPLVEMTGSAGRKASGRPEQKTSEEIAATLVGVPGVGQFKKVKKGFVEGLPFTEAVLGSSRYKGK